MTHDPSDAPNPLSPEMLVPERLFSEVARHVLLNVIYPDKDPPLFLAIVGDPGTGKSRGIDLSCEYKGWHAEHVRGSALANVEQGRPIQQLIASVQKAADAIPNDRVEASVVVIDDFDLTIVNTKENRTYTEHTQLLTSAFMDLNDKHHKIIATRQRIPILLTMNTNQGFYGPLVRSGRMRTWTWEPTRDERDLMARSAMGGLAPFAIEKLLKHFPKEHVAFFSHIRSQALALGIERHFSGNIPIPQLRSLIDDWLVNQSHDYLYELGEEIIASRKRRDQT